MASFFYLRLQLKKGLLGFRPEQYKNTQMVMLNKLCKVSRVPHGKKAAIFHIKNLHKKSIFGLVNFSIRLKKSWYAGK